MRTLYKEIKVHIDLIRTLIERGKSTKTLVFLKTYIKFEENSITQVIKVGNNVIPITGIENTTVKG